MRNNFLRFLAFLLVFLLCFHVVNYCFKPGGEFRNAKAAFYEEPQNSIEVVIVGSSSLLRGISPMVLYREFGISSFSMATVLQSPEISELMVEEVLRYQTPKVLLINFESIMEPFTYDYAAREGHTHLAMDALRFSFDKLWTAVAICQKDENQSVFNYLFPVVRYHDAWHDGSFTRLEQEASCMKGFGGVSPHTPQVLEEPYMTQSGTVPTLLEDSLQYYRNAVETAQEAGMEVVVLKLPRTTWTLEEHEQLAALAAELGCAYLDFNTPEMWQKTGISLESDFYDDNHLCLCGAEKLSIQLGEYLVSNYTLTDIRAEESYAAWETDLAEYEAAQQECVSVESE